MTITCHINKLVRTPPQSCEFAADNALSGDDGAGLHMAEPSTSDTIREYGLVSQPI